MKQILGGSRDPCEAVQGLANMFGGVGSWNGVLKLIFMSCLACKRLGLVYGLSLSGPSWPIRCLLPHWLLI